MKPTFNTAELFTPGRLGPYTLPHRVLMAPMTRNRARRDGVPSPSAVIYYAQRATAGMIVTETTTVSEQALGYPLIPGIHTADQVAGWRPVVDAMHRFGCRFFLYRQRELRLQPRDEGDRGRACGLRFLRQVVSRESGPATPFCS